MKTIPLISVFLFMFCIAHSQRVSTISGKITGLKNEKVFLGNKPNGINRGFNYIIFDSVVSKDGTFKFPNFKFNEINFYSIQCENSEAWLPFLIDTGNTIINAKKNSIFKGIVTGSKQNDIYQLYKENLIRPYGTYMNPLSDSLDKYRYVDTNQFNHYLKIASDQAELFLLNRKNFIKQHPNSYVSLMILNEIQKREVSNDTLFYYFNLLSSELQNHTKAINLKYKINDFCKNITSGHKVPDFVFYDMQNSQNNLYNIHSKYKLINFWASWCGPCLEELPQLRILNKKYKDLSIISFSIDYKKEEWISATKKK